MVVNRGDVLLNTESLIKTMFFRTRKRALARTRHNMHFKNIRVETLMTMRMCAFTDSISDIAWQLLCFLDHHDSVLECVAARRMPEVHAEVRAGRNCRLCTMAPW